MTFLKATQQVVLIIFVLLLGVGGLMATGCSEGDNFDVEEVPSEDNGGDTGGTDPPGGDPPGGGGGSTVYDDFSGSGGLDPSLWDTYNSVPNSRLEITRNSGRYYADLKGDATPQQTLWFNGAEGRLDYVSFNGDFEFIVRNMGIETGSVASEFQFCGLVVWLSPTNYEFAVVGNRGGTGNTLEYKITGSGSSTQSDTGANTFPSAKGDLRVVRSGSDVDFYYQQPGGSSWTLVDHDGLFASRIGFGSGTVRVGLITYGFSFPDPFVCTADQVEIISGTPL